MTIYYPPESFGELHSGFNAPVAETIEFFTAIAPQLVLLPLCISHYPGHCGKNIVSGLMSIGVIYLFKMVYVHDNETEVIYVATTELPHSNLKYPVHD